MKNIILICNKFIYLNEYHNSSEILDAKYPSSNWSATSWTYWLLLDFINFGIEFQTNLHRRSKFNFLNNLNWKKKLNRFSNHYDFTSKVYLFKILNDAKNKEKILLPECGPVGLEVLMAKAAGFKEIVTYDSNDNYINIFNNIWQNVKCFKSESAHFDFKKYIDQGYIILIPFWGHDNIEQIEIPEEQKIKVFDKQNLNSHLKFLTYDDFKELYTALDNLKFNEF